MYYPKIDTLFNRDNKTFKVKEDEFRHPEFKKIQEWEHTTEKIHGMNTRVMIGPLDTGTAMGTELLDDRDLLEPQVFYLGRGDNSQIPKPLLSYLRETYTVDKLLDALSKAKGSHGVVLYMEGYGSRIQDGDNYRKDVSTRIFDVLIMDMNGPCRYTREDEQPPPSGWWLEPNVVQKIADDLGVETVPSLGKMSTEEIVEYVKNKIPSIVANAEGGNSIYPMEGVVARTTPTLLFRNGRRLMFKLKYKDF